MLHSNKVFFTLINNLKKNGQEPPHFSFIEYEESPISNSFIVIGTLQIENHTESVQWAHPIVNFYRCSPIFHTQLHNRDHSTMLAAVVMGDFKSKIGSTIFFVRFIDFSFAFKRNWTMICIRFLVPMQKQKI